ncbi:MAG: hypothetical protein JWM90_2153 [Thermoleophilia bacterium]|nr:hypothetical protein [Thermoleophilia bacterium]
MNNIRTYPWIRHIRTEPTWFTLHYRNGKRVRAGRGEAFWFNPHVGSIVQVPLDDRELHFVFHARSADYQDVAAQGVVTYRLTQPEVIADHIDFTIDLDTGQFQRTPLEQLSSLITQLSQQFVLDYLSRTPLRTILFEGVDEVRGRMLSGLREEQRLTEMGIEIIAVRVASLAPTPEIEAALQMPTREAIQQDADQATFQRRAVAVEQERAIEENELQSRIELSKRREQLVTQDGLNERRAASEQTAAQGIRATAEAERITQLEGARIAAERERVAAYAGADPAILLALAATEFARKVERIDNLTITPDMLDGLLAKLNRTRTLEA